LTNEIISEIIKGNGNGYNNKEILQAHIQDDKEFKKEMREEFKWVRKQFGKVHTRFEEGSGKIAEIRIRQGSIVNVLKYGIGPLIFLILGWLAKLQIKP